MCLLQAYLPEAVHSFLSQQQRRYAQSLELSQRFIATCLEDVNSYKYCLIVQIARITSSSPRQQVRAQAAAIAPPVTELSDEERAALAKEYGYRSIGKELDDSVTLQQIIKSMPEEVYVLSYAWKIQSLFIILAKPN